MSIASPVPLAPPAPPPNPSDSAEPDARDVCECLPWLEALDAPECRTGSGVLGHAWEDLMRGGLRPLRETITNDSVCLAAQVVERPAGLSPDDAVLVANVLRGEPRKAIAVELGIALSTATARFLRALAKLELAERNVSLPVVLAAQSWAGVTRIPGARSAFFNYEGRRCFAISVPRPTTSHLTSLTRVEQEIAQWLIEGLTRYEIAERRETAVYTVAGQCHAVFAALRVTGRYELIRRAVDLRCFP